MAKQEVPAAFRDQAHKNIRVAMVKADLSYLELALKLKAEYGQNYTDQSLRVKVSRKSYGADFYLMVLAACDGRM